MQQLRKNNATIKMEKEQTVEELVKRILVLEDRL